MFKNHSDAELNFISVNAPPTKLRYIRAEQARRIERNDAYALLFVECERLDRPALAASFDMSL